MTDPDKSPRAHILTDHQRAARDLVYALQDQICAGLEAVERAGGGDARFVEDLWRRDGGGGGRTRVLSGGVVLEKGGVNVSTVHGSLGAEMAARLPGAGGEFFATGVSLVLHPTNPYAPTCHANFRYLERGDRAWFGGGADLTPYYPFPEDSAHFHRVWQDVCERHPQVADYGRFRDWCDRYFYLPHRGERRGVGGIFFDDLVVGEAGPFAALADFVRDAGEHFLAAYEPILRRRMDTPHGDRERTWQLRRRGRYVEFNLIYDRGTVFGLKTGGRVESILMSLPPLVRWDYDVEPEPGSPEAALLDLLRRPPQDGARGG